MAQQARAAIVGVRHAAEMASVDVGDAVVPGQPLVQEGVVGGQQFHDAAVRLQLVGEEQLRLLDSASRRLSSNSGKRSAFGDDERRLRSHSHWPPKLATKADDR